ncbi:amidase [Mangrovicoccus algicola]|uniref:Amidase n=1 Tax=Mangrovicoccus algicola TaxID=2771008 RepID=A0A8J6YXI0_9RHOB|nr:amidase [Mangrovicoccus algicola]MBE3639517.1 amidase [Mangrovicoccus algicola]
MAIDPFVTTFPETAFPVGDGPLSGLRLAVKDNLSVAGHVPGSGHPGWAAAQPAATRTAPVAATLMAAGARLVGTTHMDELAYSLMGENAHYGTPLNPAAPDRVPGGSSSGSASAVAQDLADIALGTDTGGSVRLPASFCGLWGWRPTHGLLPDAGMQPLAASYDVPGLFARDAETLIAAARVLAPAAEIPVPRYLAPRELWAEVPGATAAALRPHLPEADPAPIFSAEEVARLQPVFRVAQGADVAEVFGDWIRATDPQFGPGVRDRFDGALALSPEEIAAARAARDAIRAQVRAALGSDGILVIPTAPGAAPLLNTSGAEMDRYRNAAIRLLSVAGHAGLPQVTMPVAQIEGAPLGLSLVGPAGSDLALIALAAARVAAETLTA